MKLPRLRRFTIFASLRSRIVVLFVSIVLVMQVAGFGVIRTALFRYADATVADELATGGRVLERVIRQSGERLEQAVTVLAADFAFREAVATGERATVDSALRNHGERIGANLAMLVDPNGNLVSDTLHPDAFGTPFPFPKLLLAAQGNRMSSAVALLDDAAYQLVVVPVLAPLPIASVVMGFRIDDGYAQDVAALTHLDVSFAATVSKGETKVVASTLDPHSRARLQAVLRNPTSGPFDKVTLQDRPYRVSAMALPVAGGVRFQAVVQRALYEAYAPFEQLQTTLIFLSVGALIAAIAVSVVTTGNLTEALAHLAGIAERIGRGEAAQAAPLRGTSELRALATAFNRMRSDLAERESRIVDLAYRDNLTGLPNRAMFHERIAEALAQARASNTTAAVLLIDLDHFKYVNDALGHRYGDLLLREVGERLSRAVEPWNGICARLGGDEFAVVLGGGDAEVARQAAEAVLASLEPPAMVEGQSLNVGASVGVAIYPTHAEDVESLLSRVDMAMYSAKREQTGWATYTEQLDHGAHERLSLLSDLRRAIETGQLALHYQPKLHLASGEVWFVEALIRWNHPERGAIPPDRFIPFAEQTGLIKLVTRWVVGEAVRQLEVWSERGWSIGVAVNVSARDLLDPDLPEMIERLLRAHNVSPESLRIEITESAVMDDPRRALATLHRLQAMGLSLSIDDFGTGYSSLAYLHKLPVDELKIDGSFVRNMLNNQDDDTIVRSTIDLGHNMGLKVVAEGVEDHATVARLKRYGCDLVQGFILARPLPLDALEDWMIMRGNETTVPHTAARS